MGTGGGGDGGGDRLEDGEVAFRLSDRDRDRDEKSLSIMSPFDEQEEWAKISEIMASFGTGLVRESVFVSELEKEFQTRLGNPQSPRWHTPTFRLPIADGITDRLPTSNRNSCSSWYSRIVEDLSWNHPRAAKFNCLRYAIFVFSPLSLSFALWRLFRHTDGKGNSFTIFYVSGLSSDTSSSPIVSTSVGQWLSSLGLADYESLFINYGFDDLEFIVSRSARGPCAQYVG